MPWRKQSFDVLPALSVRRGDLRSSLRRVTQAWMLGVIWMTIIFGSRITIFGRMVGFDDWHFGIMAALPFIATFGQLIATVLIENTGLRKFQFLYFGAAHRALWILVALIPVFFRSLPNPVAVWVMLGVMAVSWFCNALSTPAWWSWMGDLIPRRIRGRYMANRSRISQMVQIPLVLVIGFVLTELTNPNQPYTADAQPVLLWSISAVFVIAAIFGVLDILAFASLREVIPSTKDAPRESALKIDVPRPAKRGVVPSLRFSSRYAVAVTRDVLIDPLRDKGFRHAVGYMACMTAVGALIGPFTWRNALENIRLNQFAADMLYLVISPLIGLAVCRPIGRLVDRWGRRPMLWISTILTMFSIMPVFFASRLTPSPLWLVDAINRLSGWIGGLWGNPALQWVPADAPVGAFLLLMLGVFAGSTGWMGVGVCQSGIMLGFSESPGRSKYIAASSVIVSLGGVLGGLAGGAIAQGLEFMQADPIVWGTCVWTNWHVLFFLSVILRGAALCWLVGMPDPGSMPLVSLARQARTNVYNFLSTRLFYRWRVFGWSDSVVPSVREARANLRRAKAGAKGRVKDVRRRRKTLERRVREELKARSDVSVEEVREELKAKTDAIRQQARADLDEARKQVDEAAQQLEETLREARKSSEE